MTSSMSTRAGEVRVLTLVDVSLDPYDRRNAHPKPGKLDVRTYGDMPFWVAQELRNMALDGLQDEPQHCRDCGEPIGYHRDPDEEGCWIWHACRLITSSGHVAALCDSCGIFPEPVAR